MIKIAEILRFLDNNELAYTFRGDPNQEIDGYSSLTSYRPGSFTWIKTVANIPTTCNVSELTLIFTDNDIFDNFQNVIHTKEAKRAFFSVIEHFYDKQDKKPPIGQHTYIGPNVKLGKNVHIGHNCTLDGEITIGEGTVIWNNVTIINHVIIGKHTEIHSGVVIGHDGFAYTEDRHHHKQMVRHYGGVKIGNDVSIFENVCITRGTIDDTTIEDGVKIDSLSHIAHNVHICKNAALAAPCHLNGSVQIDENAYLAGATVRNQRRVGRDAFVGLGAIVVKDVDADTTVVGNPARVFISKK